MEENGKKEERGKGVRRALFALGAVALAAVFFAAGWFSRWFSIDGRMRDLIWAFGVVNDEFYREPDEDALYDALYGELGLDPYSRFYTEEEYSALYASNAGAASGFGFSLYSLNDPMETVVYRVNGNSPAERAGLRSGMHIYRFGASEEALSAGSRETFLAAARAAEGPFLIECGYDPASASVLVLEREDYRVSYCLYRDAESSFRFDPEDLTRKTELGEPLTGLPADTAYVRISEFHGTAAQEFERCLMLMRERGKKNLVLDLRANGGGYLSVFRSIAAFLLRNASEKNPVVATARYRSGKEVTYTSGNYFGDYFEADAQIYILADENTASASECLIGALFSWGTADGDTLYLHGDDETAHTYGKGIMQSNYQSASGSVMKLTVAEIFWPDGTSIHGKGVVAKDAEHAIPAPAVAGERDVFLDTFLERAFSVTL